eukprot:1159002-Pelagomonas_calceolata.AAC.11
MAVSKEDKYDPADDPSWRPGMCSVSRLKSLLWLSPGGSQLALQAVMQASPRAASGTDVCRLSMEVEDIRSWA